MSYIMNLLQLIGGIILSIGYIPQIKQIMKTKSVSDFNFKYLFSITLGVGLMEIYAVYNLIQGVATMFFITNTISFSLALIMLTLHKKYKK